MRITINDDFDLKKIADSGQCFRVKEFAGNTYRFITGNEILYICPLADNQYELSCDLSTWEQVWYPYFDLSRNYREIRTRIKVRDRYLQTAAEAGCGIRVLRQDPWEMLITFIISQQKTIPAIKNCVETLCQNHGAHLSSAWEDLYSFPTAEQLLGVTDDLLREYKLGYRAPYLLGAIRLVAEGQLDLHSLTSLSDRKLAETLKQVNGIGDKVANCICLFAYGRTKLAPVDTWIKKVIDQKYRGKNPFPRYGNAAGIMQQYIFYYAQTHKSEF